MEKLIAITIDKCTGCRSCELACSYSKTGLFNPSRSRVRVIKMEEAGLDLPILCQQCEDPICMDVCPVDAIKRKKDGIVDIDHSLCRGCRACLMVCPYGAISIDDGQMVKCDLCDGNPQCVQWCVTGALQYTKASLLSMSRRREAAAVLCQSALKARG